MLQAALISWSAIGPSRRSLDSATGATCKGDRYIDNAFAAAMNQTSIGAVSE
jgi:hypothetical protein